LTPLSVQWTEKKVKLKLANLTNSYRTREEAIEYLRKDIKIEEPSSYYKFIKRGLLLTKEENPIQHALTALTKTLREMELCMGFKDGANQQNR
jgi:hypothetical protein